MPRPPLHPDSLITQAQADDLDALLDAYRVEHQGMLDAEAALEAEVAAASTGLPADEAADLFGDGRGKKRELCVTPSGRGLSGLKPPPDARGRRKKPRKAPKHDKGESRAAGRRHRDAVVTVGDMQRAERAVEARRKAYGDRAAAAQALVLKVGELSFPDVPIGFAVDVWGDGRLRRAEKVRFPTGLRPTKVRVTYTSGQGGPV